MPDNREILEKRRQAYASLFSGPNADIVLADLANFCRADTTTFHDNRHISDMLDGRREVFLRIKEHTDLSPDALWHKKIGA